MDTSITDVDIVTSVDKEECEVLGDYYWYLPGKDQFGSCPTNADEGLNRDLIGMWKCVCMGNWTAKALLL